MKEWNGVERKATDKLLVPTICKAKCWGLQVQVCHGGGVIMGRSGTVTQVSISQVLNELRMTCGRGIMGIGY